MFLCLIIIVTITFPFANIFHLIYPLTIFNKSAWIAVPSIIIGLCYIYITTRKNSRLSSADLLFILLSFLSWLIFLIREITYDESSSYLDMRFVVTSLLFLLVMRHLIKDVFVLRVMAYAVVIQGFLVAALRNINYYFFPSVMVTTGVDGTGFINTQGELTRDLLIASSISGNHIVCGMFVLLSLKKYNVLKLNFIPFMIIQLFMMVAVFNTISRFPIAMAIGLFIFSLFSIKVRDLLMLSFTSLIIFFGINYAGIEIPTFIYRYSEGSGDRLDKFMLTLELIQRSPVNFLIGSSLAELGSAHTENGVVISDNSYGLIALAFGLPFALAYFTFLFNYFIKNKSGIISIIFFSYTFVNLGLTNSILWEPWVFTAFSTFIIVSYLSKISLHLQNICRPNRINHA